MQDLHYRLNKILAKNLVELGILTDLPKEKDLRSYKTGIICRLASRGEIDEKKTLIALSKHLRIEYHDFNTFDASKYEEIEDFDELLPITFIRRHKIIPLYYDKSKNLVVGVVNPYDLEGIKIVDFTYKANIKKVLIKESKLNEILEILTSKWDIGMDTSKFDSLELKEKDEDIGDSIDVNVLNAPPVIRLVNKIIHRAVVLNASDIHLEPTEDGLDVRYRIDGVLQHITDIPKKLVQNAISRCKIIAGMDITEKRQAQDGRISILVDAEKIDLRISSLPTTYGEKIVMRILASNAEHLTFDILGMPSAIEKKFLEDLEKESGMILVTGPTGSGKTTTLYASLNRLKDGATNISTIEHPIENRVQGINQTQIDPNGGITFASALRSLLRQDPDVIMLGEIRDTETALTAYQAAETGHKVLSTLHANSAPAVINRLRIIEVPDFLVASSTSGVMAQRLIRKICLECKEEVKDSKILKSLKKYDIEFDTIYQSRGCNICEESGFKGRTGIYSYLSMNTKLASLIHEQASEVEIAQEAKKYGFKDLSESALDLLQDGLTTFEEVKPYLEVSSKSNESLERENSQFKSIKQFSTLQSSLEKSSPSLKTYIQTEKKRKILFIDDDPIMRSMFTWILKKENFQTLVTNNGEEALEKLENYQPDLILCDLKMPIMDGTQFLKEVKELNDFKDIPIIILTAEESSEVEVELLKLGASDFINKSKDQSIFLTRVEKVLNSYAKKLEIT